MSIDLAVYKTRRMVPVRFERAVTGNPDIAKPDVDTRGNIAPDFYPVVGVVEGASIRVKLVRQALENSADLFVTSSDAATAKVEDPADCRLPQAAQTEIQVKGVSGDNPKTAKLQVRFGSATGPIVGILTVRVYSKLSLRITPHNVLIKSSSAAEVGSAADIGAIIDLVRAIWAPCGLELTVGAAQSQHHTFRAAGRAQWRDEVEAILTAGFVPNTINAYFVNCLVDTGPHASGGVLGWGLSRQFATSNGLPSPGILLGDTNVNGSARATDAMWLANDLAHEIGHFLQLPHTESKEPPNERRDNWSRRRLMHNFNLQARSADWHDDFGYGTSGTGGTQPRRGCMVTMKDLSQLTSDGEVVTVRNTILSPQGPY